MTDREKYCIPQICYIGTNNKICISVSDLYHFDADPDPDPACNFDADPYPDPDPDIAFYFDSDPDPSFQIKAQNFVTVLK